MSYFAQALINGIALGGMYTILVLGFSIVWGVMGVINSLMYEPRLVLMDEPSAGLAPIVTRQIFAAIARLNREIGLTVLMIEQNARQGLEASHRGYVIEMGRITHEGRAADLLGDHQVRRAFLGAR